MKPPQVTVGSNMNATQAQSLTHFESFYPAFVSAIEDEDAERVAELVEERKDALAQLLEAFAGTLLPETVREHIEGSEALVRTRLLRFFDQIIVRLSEERVRSYAVARYQETAQ